MTDQAVSTGAGSRLVFIVGDSISVGYGPHLERFLGHLARYDRKRNHPGQIAEADLDVPQGANGGDSARVLEYLRHRREHDPIPPGLLLLNCGLHDIKTDPQTGAIQVPIENYRENLVAAIAEARQMQLDVVWVRTTPVIDAIHNARNHKFHRHQRDLDAYNAAADRIMLDHRIPSIDLHGFSLAFLPQGFLDHVHFHGEISVLQGAYLAGAVEQILAR